MWLPGMTSLISAGRIAKSLEKAETGFRPVPAALNAKQRDRAELAVDRPRRFKVARLRESHSRRDIRRNGLKGIEFAARTIDFELGHRLFARWPPVEDVLAAPCRVPEYLVNL